MAAFVVLLRRACGAIGFLWVRGDLDTAAPTRSPRQRGRQARARRPVPRRAPPPSARERPPSADAQCDAECERLDRQAADRPSHRPTSAGQVDINPAPARPRPLVLPPVVVVQGGVVQLPGQQPHRRGRSLPGHGLRAATHRWRPRDPERPGHQRRRHPGVPTQPARDLPAAGTGLGDVPGALAGPTRRRELRRLAHRHLGAGEAGAHRHPVLQRPDPSDAVRVAPPQRRRACSPTSPPSTTPPTSGATCSGSAARRPGVRSTCSTSSSAPASRSSSPAT